MQNQKSTKRAFGCSVVAVAICVAMLIGTTFAWFTSTASTAVNKIEAGTLAVDIQDENGNSLNEKTLQWQKAAGHENEAVLWEPGAEYKLTPFKIVNTGKLALKYKIAISGLKGSAKLLQALTFTYTGENGETVDLSAEGHLAAGQLETGLITLTSKMNENTGNEYQGLTIDGIAITVYATQDTVEYDSNNNTYDENAEYPQIVTLSEFSNMSLEDIATETGSDTHKTVEVPMGNKSAEPIQYSEHNSGYTGKGVMLGSQKLNRYGAAPAAAGDYKFTFKNGVINSAATGYESIDNFTDTSVYMLVPGNSDVVFENMTFNGVVSFDVQIYTSPWSYLNSITFKNCTFNGIVIGACPANKAVFTGCTFNNYTNSASANNSNPIWWRAANGSWSGDPDSMPHSLQEFTFVNNKVTSTRPVKIERIGWSCTAKITILDNKFDIQPQVGDDVTKNMAINIGQRDNTSKFILTDDGNTISANTAALYTAALTGGSNQYIAVSGTKILNRAGKNKTITAMVWKTQTNETFTMKTID